MKMLLFILMLSSVPALSQDRDVVVTPSWLRDTLTATKDTVDIQFKDWDTKELNSWSIVAFTTTLFDTVTVSTQALDGTIYSQCALTDLSTGLPVTSIIITTTPK